MRSTQPRIASGASPPDLGVEVCRRRHQHPAPDRLEGSFFNTSRIAAPSAATAGSPARDADPATPVSRCIRGRSSQMNPTAAPQNPFCRPRATTSAMGPRVLLTNDDGVNSVGLWAAYDALPDRGCDRGRPGHPAVRGGPGRSRSSSPRGRTGRRNRVRAARGRGQADGRGDYRLFALELAPDLVVSGSTSARTSRSSRS